MGNRILGRPYLRVIINLGLIAAGCLVYIVGLKGIIVPHEFLNGGLTGIALIMVYLKPSLNLGLLIALLNIPMILMGWFTVSRRFIYYTIFGIAVFSLGTDLIDVPKFNLDEPILAAILAGIICGIGAGLILRSQGSAGGIDVLAVYLYKKYSLKPGMTSFMVNAVILCLGAFFFSLEMAMYTLIFIYTQGKLTDAVVSGFNRRKSVMIISDYGPQIADLLLKRFPHGLTILEGKGAYSGTPKEIVFGIISLNEMAQLKEATFSIDPNAFVVFNETMDVLGAKMGRGRTY